VKLRPGVTVTDTPALNEAGVSQSQLIRYMPDPILGGVIQKTGGWIRFYASTTTAIVRALWAWEDTNAVTHLAEGTQQIGSTGSSQLGVITNGVLQDITPRASSDDVTQAASTTLGSSIVTITDATATGITSYDTVYIETHMSVGGLVLFGLYPTTLTSNTTYQITATDILGNPLAATSTTTTTTVANFTTVSGSSVVTVTLNNHGYTIGSTYPVLVSTTVGGITLYGNYIVNSVIDANNFTINGTQVASASTSGFINGGLAYYVYSYGVGAIPAGTGYGIGGYGSGGYGTGTAITPSTGAAILANDWTLDNWGEVLLAVPINGTLFQPIYQWDPLSGAPTATIIPQAPPLNDGMFVAMPQRQIIAWGSTVTGIQDPLLVRWCDVNNYGVWIGTVTNQAGSYRVPKGSKIVGGIQGPQQSLIWTDLGVWAMQYTGPPYIYSFNEIGFGCGLISRKAAASVNGIVYWMGPSQFYQLSGNGVETLPCSVWDVIFQNLDSANASKIRVAVNSRFGEIAWFYPSLSGGGEVDSYVKLNYLIQQWDYGSLARSAWIDQSVLGPPIGADPNSRYIYQHETSTDADGQPLLASFQTGYYAMDEADLKTFVDQVWPDMRFGYYNGSQNATVNLTFYVADYAGQTPITFGPYPMTQATTFITPRFRGRLVSIGFASSDTGSFWRTGNLRYRYSADGKF
jgi:hypothetical protein